MEVGSCGGSGGLVRIKSFHLTRLSFIVLTTIKGMVNALAQRNNHDLCIP